MVKSKSSLAIYWSNDGNDTYMVKIINILKKQFSNLFLCVALSYAYWRLTLTQSNSNLVTSDCFSLEFTDENDITLQNAYPMDYEELFHFFLDATPYHFTVTNKCDKEMYYTINLESLLLLLLLLLLLENGVKKLPDKYVDIILVNGDYTFLELFNLIYAEESEENRIKYYQSFYNPTYFDILNYREFSNVSNLKINQEKVLPNTETSYIVFEDKIDAKESKSNNLYLFMNTNTPAIDETMNANWEAKVTITSSYEVSNNTLLENQKRMENMIQVACSNTYHINTYYDKCVPAEVDSFRTSGYNISSIVIQDVLNPPENYVAEYDESFLKNGKVKSYIVKNEENEENLETYTAYIQADEKITLPPDSSSFFDIPSLRHIEGLNNLDLSLALSIRNMFANLTLENLDLSGWDISNLVDQFSIFYNSNISNLDLSNWTIERVTDEFLNDFLSSLLSNANVENLNLSSWSMYGAQDFSLLFRNLDVSTLDLSNWDTSKIYSMYEAFAYSNIQTLNLTNWDTSNVCIFKNMFKRAKKLTNIIYGSKFIYANNANAENMFYDCPANRPTDTSWSNANLD